MRNQGGSFNTPSIQSKQRFTSYDRSSATGLDYAVNRTYNAGQGRFTQVDPIGMAATSLAIPQSLNLYAYCLNDPINWVDPSGLFIGEAGAAGAAVGGPVGFVIATVVSALLGWLFRGRKPAAAKPVSIQVNFRSIDETGSSMGWDRLIRDSAISGVGGVAAYLQQKPKRTTGTSDAEIKKRVDAAVQRALQALKKSECRALIAGPKGKDPGKTLKTIEEKGKISIHSGDSKADLGLGGDANIRFNDLVFDPGYKGSAISMGLPPGTGQMETEAIEVLHETSHATGKYSHPGYKPGLEVIMPHDLNNKIKGVCFPGNSSSSGRK